jgi:hypothetical protein
MAGVMFTPGRCERQGTVRGVAVGDGGQGRLLVEKEVLQVTGLAGLYVRLL